MLKTKEDLLAFMAHNHACSEATEWVESREGSFAEIVSDCDSIDWLAWLLAHIRPRAAAEMASRAVNRARERDGGHEYIRVAALYEDRAHSMADDDQPPVTSLGEVLYYARLAAGADRVIEADAQLHSLRSIILELS